MNKLITQEEENFLDYLLKSYHNQEKSYVHDIVNLDIIKNAVTLFLNYFNNEDVISSSNHSAIIKSLFIENKITNKNCGSILGISVKTLYRYKQKYLQVFKNYLTLSLEPICFVLKQPKYEEIEKTN